MFAQPKIYTWESYAFITFSVLSTAEIFLIYPMVHWFGPNTVTPMSYSISIATILSISPFPYFNLWLIVVCK